MGLIKKVATEANLELELLKEEIAKAITQVAKEVITGKLYGQFAVGVFRTGSRTSTNMNTNEVIANGVIELQGEEIGSREIHPKDHVNLRQSSNDVVSTVIHISALKKIDKRLIPALRLGLRYSF